MEILYFTSISCQAPRRSNIGREIRILLSVQNRLVYKRRNNNKNKYVESLGGSRTNFFFEIIGRNDGTTAANMKTKYSSYRFIFYRLSYDAHANIILMNGRSGNELYFVICKLNHVYSINVRFIVKLLIQRLYCRTRMFEESNNNKQISFVLFRLFFQPRYESKKYPRNVGTSKNVRLKITFRGIRVSFPSILIARTTCVNR